MSTKTWKDVQLGSVNFVDVFEEKTLLIFYYFVFPTDFLLHKYYYIIGEYIFENGKKEYKQGFPIRWVNELN